MTFGLRHGRVKMRIELPWPDSSLAPNRKNGRHWGAVHSAKVKRLADARYLTLYAMRSTGYVPPAGALALSLTFCPPDRRRRPARRCTSMATMRSRADC